MSSEIAQLQHKNQAGQLADTALALDQAAFREWWAIVAGYFQARGAAERLFQRAFLLGMMAMSGDATELPGEIAADDAPCAGRECSEVAS